MLGLLLFALMVFSPVTGERVIRADDESLQALISAQAAQAAAIQDLQARLSVSEATIRQLQSTQGHTVGFLVDFGQQPYHNVLLSASGPVLFNRVVTNVGGAYDAATGYFTAPYRGLYFFHLHFMGGLHDNNTNLSIDVDDSHIAVAYADGNSHDEHDQGSCNAVVHLSGREKVSIKLYYGRPEIWGSVLTSFSGALIHTD